MGQDPEFFSQAPPQLGNQYDDDRMLRSLLTRRFGDRLGAVRGQLLEMGALAGDELYRLQLADRLNEPVLTRWGAWGERIDEIAVTPLWQTARRLACSAGSRPIPPIPGPRASTTGGSPTWR